MKYTLALCAFAAFAAIVQAGPFDNLINNAKTAADNAIIKANERLQAAAKDHEERYNKFITAAEARVEKAKDSIKEKVKEVVEKIDQYMDSVETEATEDAERSSCRKIVTEMKNETINVVSEANKCMSEKIDVFKAKSASIKEKVSELTKMYNDQLGVNIECVSNHSDSTVSKIACMSKNNLKAIAEIGKKLPTLLAEKARFGAMILTAPFQTRACVTSSLFYSTVNNLKSRLSKIEECIALEKKVPSTTTAVPTEASSVTPTPSTTSETTTTTTTPTPSTTSETTTTTTTTPTPSTTSETTTTTTTTTPAPSDSETTIPTDVVEIAED